MDNEEIKINSTVSDLEIEETLSKIRHSNKLKSIIIECRDSIISAEKVEKLCDEIQKMKKDMFIGIKLKMVPEIKYLEELLKINYPLIGILPKSTDESQGNKYYELSEYYYAQSKMNEFLQNIKENNLSPFESYIYAYDIVKSFKYNETKLDEAVARNTTSIFKHGDIVCLGYAKLLSELLEKLNIYSDTVSTVIRKKDIDKVTIADKIKEINFPFMLIDRINYSGHKRNLIMIKDEKYDIEEVFLADATWDSRNDKDKTPLNKYKFFYIPFEKARETFGEKENMDVYDCMENPNNIKRIRGKAVIYRQIFRLYDLLYSGLPTNEDTFRNTKGRKITMIDEEKINRVKNKAQLISEIRKNKKDKKINTDKFMKALFKVRKIQFPEYSDKEIFYNVVASVKESGIMKYTSIENIGKNIGIKPAAARK